MNNNETFDDVNNSHGEANVKKEKEKYSYLECKPSTKQEPMFYSCEDCGRQFASKHNMFKHIKEIHLKIKYECDQCDYKAGHKSGLVRHQLAKHGDGVRYLKCHLCPKTYKWDADLKRHIEKHSNNKYQCDSCEKQFAEKRNLQSHIKSVHLKITHKCKFENCDYEASSLQNLRFHEVKVHDIGIASKFKCKFCDYETARKSDLNRHLNVKHLEVEKIQCHLCDYQSVRKDQLILHQKKVHLNCNICNKYRSKSKKDLKEHQRQCSASDQSNETIED